MYKIIKAQGKNGINKLESIEKKHSLYGELHISRCICFEYKDNSGLMMCTSSVEDVSVLGKYIMVTTRNTEYCFEKVSD